MKNYNYNQKRLQITAEMNVRSMTCIEDYDFHHSVFWGIFKLICRRSCTQSETLRLVRNNYIVTGKCSVNRFENKK